MESDLWCDGAVPLAPGDGVEGRTLRRRLRAAATPAAGVLGLLAVALLAPGGSGPGPLQTTGVAQLAADGHRRAAQRTFKFLTVELAEQYLSRGLTDAFHPFTPPRLFAEEVVNVTNAALLAIRASLFASGWTDAEVPIVGLVAARTPPQFDAAVAKSVHLHPNVLKLSITGGVCAGKTSSKHTIKKELERKSNGSLLVVSVPEVASVLYGQGAMNYGTGTQTGDDEYFQFVVHATIVQLAFEEIFTRAAEAMLERLPRARRVVVLCDRDTIDAKSYSLPVDPDKRVVWSEVVEETGRLLGRPYLTEADLAAGYELGTVVLQTFAIVDGEPNPEGYNRVCTGPQGSNPMRHESLEEARRNDEHVKTAYEFVYPKNKICWVTNKKTQSFAEKVQRAVDCVWHQLDERVQVASG